MTKRAIARPGYLQETNDSPITEAMGTNWPIRPKIRRAFVRDNFPLVINLSLIILDDKFSKLQAIYGMAEIRPFFLFKIMLI